MKKIMFQKLKNLDLGLFLNLESPKGGGGEFMLIDIMQSNKLWGLTCT